MTLRIGMLVKLDLRGYSNQQSYLSYSSRELNTSEREISKNEIGILVRIMYDLEALVLFGDKLEVVSACAIQGLNGEV